MSKYNITVSYDYTSRDKEWITVEAENEEEAKEKAVKHINKSLSKEETISNIEFESVEKKLEDRYYYVSQCIIVWGVRNYIDFYVCRTKCTNDGIFQTLIKDEVDQRKDKFLKQHHILDYSLGKLEIEEVTLEEYMCGRSCTL